jgi:hypothetical protein
MFVSKNIEIPKNFYDVNKYVVQREIESYNNRIKFFNINNRLYRYKQFQQEKQTAYLLLEDIHYNN